MTFTLLYRNHPLLHSWHWLQRAGSRLNGDGRKNRDQPPFILTQVKTPFHGRFFVRSQYFRAQSVFSIGAAVKLVSIL